jgi:diketogulonate reductase-like aldo/keto reductase
MAVGRLDRRTLLAAAAGAATGRDPAAAQTPTTGARMLTRRIASTGEDVPVIGLGTWQVFDVAGSTAELDERRAVLETLFAAGGRMIDSSPMYGRAEAVTGTLLAAMGARDKAWLATKVWTRGEAAGIRQMNESFARMQAGRRMDLMQVHNLVDWRTHLKTLRKWKDEGRVGAIGITHYTVPALEELAAIVRTEKIDAVQLVHSIGVTAAEDRLLPLCAERGVAVVVNQPFGQGAFFRTVRGRPLPAWIADMGIASWAQMFLQYIVSHPAVTCVIPGTAKPEHMRDNVAAGIGRLLDAAERRRLAEFWRSV